MTYRKKLIEVALPLEAINKASAKEKSIRHGHPSTLHLWWARRPLAACRAVLFASLVDDPDSDPMFAGDADIAASKRADLFNLIEELVLWENSNNPRVINRARAEIARCVATQKIEEGVFKKDDILSFPSSEMREWAASGDSTNKGKAKSIKVPVFEIRQLLAKPAQVNALLAEYAPPVLDPFCGGGSIPLEAQRLGLRAYASDLNPVPVLINKALIEIPPKFAGRAPVNPASRPHQPNAPARESDADTKANVPSLARHVGVKKQQDLTAMDWPGATGLAEDVRYYGQWMRAEAEKRIGHLYPKVEVTPKMAKERPDLVPYVGQKLTVIAWLWARTIQCPNPGCRARTPLVRSFWLAHKKDKVCYAKPVLDRDLKTVRFEIATKGEPPKHTTDRTGARCLFCDTFIKKQQLREISTQFGVAEIPLAIVAEGDRGRVYVNGDAIPSPEVKKPDVAFLEQPITNDRRWFSPPLYGMPNFADLFTSRQLAVLTTLCDLISDVGEQIRHGATHTESSAAYADAVATYLAFALSRSVDRSSTICTWDSSPKMEALRNTFARQAMPMTWDFAEGNPFSESSGNWLNNVEWVAKTVDKATPAIAGRSRQLDAAAVVAEGEPPVVSTDPPYYDNIGYADLSDFFYVWLRRSLSRVYPSLLSTVLTPKSQELIASPNRHDGNRRRAQAFFEEGFGKVFTRTRTLIHTGYPLTVYYAFKQAETDDGSDTKDDVADSSAIASTGWETMLAGLIQSGFSISGTWPMRTELGNRMVGSGTNALASSIVLVCRPRPDNAPLATRKEFIAALRRELPEALRNLQRGSIAPVDLAQATIGPGMAVFTRYAKVMESDGSPMTVRTALGLINQALDEVLAEQEGAFDGDTRWALAWFDQYGVEDGPFGVAETLSKAKNTAVNGLVEAGVIVAKAGKVRLVARNELPDGWDPTTDKRLTVWEITQHLIRKLEQEGESAAAVLVSKLGGMAEIARDLAYRLYSICERKKWADEALAYNGLVIAWSELTRLALAERTKAGATQKDLDF